MSTQPVDFAALKARWDEAAAKEDAWRGRFSLNRALRWREVERRLHAGVRTILDVGAGPGTFSIPLAKRGFAVTHLDLSPAMNAIARREAEAAGLDEEKLRFVEGNAVDLSAFADRSFDLVLCMDGALSGAGAAAEQVLRECCRVTGGTVILTALHRAWAEASALRADEEHAHHAVELASLRAFSSQELRALVEGLGLRVARCGGIGSLAMLCGKEAVTARLAADREGFVEACEHFDHEVLPDGPGTTNDTGLIAVALRSSGGDVY